MADPPTRKYRKTTRQMTYTVRYEPDVARARIVRALVKARGSVIQAAKLLRVSKTALYRWIAQFELSDVVTMQLKSFKDELRLIDPSQIPPEMR